MNKFILVVAILVTPMIAAADLEQGKKLFQERCITCHGPNGAGDGPIAASLPPDMKPRNLQEGAMKYATDDAKMKELISKGGSAVGLNALMPAQSGLSDADLGSLIEFVKSLHKK